MQTVQFQPGFCLLTLNACHGVFVYDHFSVFFCRGTHSATQIPILNANKMKASNDLLRILKDLEKTHNMKKSGTDSMNPIHALREAAGEALLPFTMSCRSSDASDSFI